jgi:hypothetical protein
MTADGVGQDCHHTHTLSAPRQKTQQRFQRSGKKIRKNPGKLSDTPSAGRIMRVMTRAHPRAIWIGLPALTEPWLEALLRAFAMLWSAVAATFQTCLAVAEGRRRMSPSRRARACDTPPAPQVLPGGTHDSFRETISAEPTSHETIEALMVVRSGPAGTIWSC